MTTFTTEDRLLAEQQEKQSQLPKEVWHFSLDAENGETKFEIKHEWNF